MLPLGQDQGLACTHHTHEQRLRFKVVQSTGAVNTCVHLSRRIALRLGTMQACHEHSQSMVLFLASRASTGMTDKVDVYCPLSDNTQYLPMHTRIQNKSMPAETCSDEPQLIKIVSSFHACPLVRTHLLSGRGTSCPTDTCHQPTLSNSHQLSNTPCSWPMLIPKGGFPSQAHPFLFRPCRT
jgi:hypothetical protein